MGGGQTSPTLKSGRGKNWEWRGQRRRKDCNFDEVLCNTSYEATQSQKRVASAQVDELIHCLLLFLGGWLLPT